MYRSNLVKIFVKAFSWCRHYSHHFHQQQVQHAFALLAPTPATGSNFLQHELFREQHVISWCVREHVLTCVTRVTVRGLKLHSSCNDFNIDVDSSSFDQAWSILSLMEDICQYTRQWCNSDRFWTRLHLPFSCTSLHWIPRSRCLSHETRGWNLIFRWISERCHWDSVRSLPFSLNHVSATAATCGKNLADGEEIPEITGHDAGEILENILTQININSRKNLK